MTSYNHTPIDNTEQPQANNAQSDSKLIRLIVDLLLITFIALCVTHCVPAYAESNGMRNAKSNERNGGSNGMSNKNNVTLFNLSNASKVFLHYKKGKNNVTENETLVLVKTIVNQAIAGNETQMKQLNETVSFKNHLTNGDVGGYYKRTTKYTAVKPSRHSLAIFMPIVRDYYSCTTTGINTQSHTSYDGLREPNTIPFFYGNKFRCLCTVVDTHRPIFSGDKLLTKYTGGLSNA